MDDAERIRRQGLGQGAIARRIAARGWRELGPREAQIGEFIADELRARGWMRGSTAPASLPLIMGRILERHTRDKLAAMDDATAREVVRRAVAETYRGVGR